MNQFVKYSIIGVKTKTYTKVNFFFDLIYTRVGTEFYQNR